MKNLILYFSILFTFSVQAQEYVFNRLIQYEENDFNQIQLYFDIDNPNYYLLLNTEKNEEVASIYDKSEMKIHHFNVKPLQEQNGLIYQYVYRDSEELFDQSSKDNPIEYEFEVTRDDNYYRFGRLTVYHKDAPTEPILIANLTLRYTHENLFSAFNLCCLMGYDQNKIIEMDDNFVVVRAKVNDGEKNISYKLIDDQVIQFQLRVRKKQE